jgi:hypothetical protein
MVRNNLMMNTPQKKLRGSVAYLGPGFLVGVLPPLRLVEGITARVRIGGLIAARGSLWLGLAMSHQNVARVL